MRLRSPAPLRPYVRSLRYASRFIRGIFGRVPRTCSVCGFHGRFLAYGATQSDLGRGFVLDALCPRCLSLGRHRLLALCDRERRLFAGKRILHFAPEPGFAAYIKQQKPASYVSCDFLDESADRKINIEAIDFPDEAFNLVYCSHVLEHVDDSRAIPELYRILQPGGLAVVMVPVVDGWDRSFEDASKTMSEQDRLLYFGQHDHIRFFGRDIRERLERPGFRVEEYVSEEPFVSQYGLDRGERVYLCWKD